MAMVLKIWQYTSSNIGIMRKETIKVLKQERTLLKLIKIAAEASSSINSMTQKKITHLIQMILQKLSPKECLTKKYKIIDINEIIEESEGSLEIQR